MSLSSGKASGKPTSYTPCTKGLVWHAEHDERIAELEAELTRTERALRGGQRALVEKLRKAEAEVTEQRKAAEKLVLEFKAEVERLSLLAKKATPRTEEYDEG